MLKKRNAKKIGYLVHENNNKYILCKIIKEFNNKDEALKELIKELKK